MTRRGFQAGRLARAALAAGLVGAVAEMILVLPIQAFVLHHSPEAVFQSIAAGAVGQAAYSGGWVTAAEGVFWHVLISVVAAAIYAVQAMRWEALLQRPVIGGVALGVFAYILMTFVVVPLSAIGAGPFRPSLMALVSFLIHLFAFGVPIAVTLRVMLLRRKLDLA